MAFFKSEVPVPEKDGATLPSWLAEARIRQDGRTLGSVVTIVDTGAQATVIDRRWAAEHGLLTRAGNVVAVDIAGSSIDTTLASDVQLSFGPVDARAVEVVVIDMPEILRRIGVVSIWSPQSTVPPGRLFRLDLRRGTLELDDATALSKPRLASCVGDRFESAALIVEAVVGGHAVRLELDSGSSDTSVIASSAAGSALSARVSGRDKTSYGAAGSFSVLELRPQVIEIDDYAKVSAVSIIGDDGAADTPANACPSEGVLGLPVLEDCQLELTATHFSLRCSNP